MLINLLLKACISIHSIECSSDFDLEPESNQDLCRIRAENLRIHPPRLETKPTTAIMMSHDGSGNNDKSEGGNAIIAKILIQNSG